MSLPNPDANGIGRYDESTPIGEQFSELLNLGLEEVSDALSARFPGVSTAFTPIVTGVTTSANSAEYTIVGGRCFVSGRMTVSAAPTGAVTVSTPVPASVSGQEPPRGTVKFVDVGTGAFFGVVDQNAGSGATAVRLLALTASGAYVGTANVSSVIPHGWAAGDQIQYQYDFPIA